MNRPIEWVYQVVGKLYLENLVLLETLKEKKDKEEEPVINKAVHD